MSLDQILQFAIIGLIVVPGVFSLLHGFRKADKDKVDNQQELLRKIINELSQLKVVDRRLQMQLDEKNKQISEIKEQLDEFINEGTVDGSKIEETLALLAKGQADIIERLGNESR